MQYYIEIFLDSWFGQVSSQKLEKYTFSGGQGRVYKILVRPAPTFLAYSGGLGSHIMHFFEGGQVYLIILFFPINLA